ncbi:hypothetical protein [Frigidibacter sp. MR17.24]|uniref:hypothetical protein n=1 Tax=Frigidibacter sp. MR17.24 TaxID=3127345 RepID=UPI003012FAE9
MIDYPVYAMWDEDRSEFWCHECGRVWKLGEGSGCEPCVVATDAQMAVARESFRSAYTPEELAEAAAELKAMGLI